MHKEETVQRFIELRASDWTYARLMTELNVSKPTLIAWSRKHQFLIQNLKTIELESLADQWLASVQERVKAWGERMSSTENLRPLGYSWRSIPRNERLSVPSAT